MVPTMVFVAIMLVITLLSKALDAFSNHLTRAYHVDLGCSELHRSRQSFAKCWEDKSLVLSMTEEIEDEPLRIRETKKKKRKSKAYAEMMKYSDEVLQPWKMADSFNSTTMRFLFDFTDGVSGNWAKVERTFASWILVVTSKVERDIKTTFKTGDFVKRKITKETKAVMTSVAEVSKPLLSLPATIQRLSGKKDSWDLIRVGVNPLSEEQMLGNFNAKNTKERARLPKKKAPNILAVDSVYRSVRLLPNKLKYDFDRKKISQEIERNERKDKNMKLLPDGNKKSIPSNRKSPLLPSFVDMEYREGNLFMEDADQEQQQQQQLYYEEDGSRSDEYNGENEEENQFFYLTREEAQRSQQLLTLLSIFSTAIKEGAIASLRTELLWALAVAEETLDIELLKYTLSGKGSNVATDHSGDEGSDTVRAVVDHEEVEDLRQWAIDRVVQSVKSLTAAIEACSRLCSLSTQVQEVEKSREKERKICIRSGDFDDLRRGVEVFVEGMSAKRDAVPVPTAVDDATVTDVEGGGGGVKVDQYVTSWGGSQGGVEERIMGNRALLAGIYSLTDGIEDLLTEQRQCQRETGRTGVSASDSAAEAQWIKDMSWTREQSGIEIETAISHSVPEGLIKESKGVDSFEDIMEKEEEKEIEKVQAKVRVEVESKKVKSNPRGGWSPGVSVMKAPPVESVLPKEDQGNDVEMIEVDSEVVVNVVNKEVAVKGVNEKVTVDDTESVSQSETLTDFFLFIAEDTESTTRTRASDGYSYRDARDSADSENRSTQNNFVETTVEATERDSDKVIAFLAASMDVTFFLVETIVKSLVPILMGGGAIAVDRAAEALSGGVIISSYSYKGRGRGRGDSDSDARNTEGGTLGSWKLLAEFKKQAAVR